MSAAWIGTITQASHPINTSFAFFRFMVFWGKTGAERAGGVTVLPVEYSAVTDMQSEGVRKKGASAHERQG